MLWPLVFIHFLLASAFRRDDAGLASGVHSNAPEPKLVAVGEGADAGGRRSGVSPAGVHPGDVKAAGKGKHAGEPRSGLPPAGVHPGDVKAAGEGKDAGGPRSGLPPAGVHPGDVKAAGERADAGGPRSGLPPAGVHPGGVKAAEKGADAGGPRRGVHPGDVVPPLDELHCRMFGYDTGGRAEEWWCRQWKQEGCGCPVEPPPHPAPPAFDTTKLKHFKVGWEATLDESTAITYSFEKEFVGNPPRLHDLYEPAFSAGSYCNALWAALDDTQKQLFMAASRNEASHMTAGAFEKFERKRDDKDSTCFIGASKLLPFKRRSTALSISDWIEREDTEAWEVKAHTFYYDLQTMHDQVREMLQYVDVPEQDGLPDGFPGERRIQVHVVASLSRQAKDRTDNPYEGGPPAANKALLRNIRLVQLYFSDYTVLRLGFPFGPKGDKCRDRDGTLFQCDVFNDDSNYVISKETARKATEDQQGKVIKDEMHKYETVGLRESEAYGGAADIECSDQDDCSTPYKVGFEIRKSESFEAALQVADSISLALQSMTADGIAQIGMRQKRDIGIVLEYAKNYRMKLEDIPICKASVPLEFRPAISTEVNVVSQFADYLKKLIRGRAVSSTGDTKKKKLWNMLTLVMCTDWSKLVPGVDPGRRGEILTSFEAVREAVFDDEEEETMEQFHKLIAQYAFDLSEGF